MFSHGSEVCRAVLAFTILAGCGDSRASAAGQSLGGGESDLAGSGGMGTGASQALGGERTGGSASGGGMIGGGMIGGGETGGATAQAGTAAGGIGTGGAAPSGGGRQGGGYAPGTPDLRAFPGAEGFGAYTKGGRGGDVYHVTTLADSGAGSLRSGITTAKGPRTIVFDVGGTIELASQLDIEDRQFLTIAGQTAPGDGITLKNATLSVTRSQDIVLRFLRVRTGNDLEKTDPGYDPDAIALWTAENVIVDHCSASWSVDSVFDVNHVSGKVSVQWCIISEALRNAGHAKGAHSMATGFDGKNGGGSYHHNLLASCNSRMPRVDAFGDPRPLVDVRNNVIYNWGDGQGYGGEHADMNFVANYYKAGPASGDKGWVFQGSGADGKIFVTGNFVDGYPEVSLHNQKGVTGSTLVAQPFAIKPTQTQAAEAAYVDILELAGASKVRDAVDLRIVKDVRNGTGALIDKPADVGGWPQLKSGTGPQDTDQDGMPDAWEAQHGLDPADAGDRNADADADGYTNLEEYLNELVEHIIR